MSQRLVIPAGGPPADFEEGSVVFVDAATAVLRYAGFAVLADPCYLDHRDHVHLGFGAAAQPRPEAAHRLEQHVPVDFAVMAQLREDCSDRRLERDLERHVPILTTPQAASTLRQNGFTAARGLPTWHSMTIERTDVEVRVTSVPGHHRAVPVELFLPDVMGSVLEFARRGEAARLRVYVSGDDLEHLQDVPGRHPDVHVVLFHLGGTRVLGIAKADGAQGVAALHLFAPRPSAPTRRDDGEPRSPLEDLAAAVRQEGLDAHVQFVAPGESQAFRPSELAALPAIPRRRGPATVGPRAGESDLPASTELRLAG